ncbi:MAG: hypothetical protein DWG82_01005 [Chloroflexi bacterium]|nr:hypothetical protein [Chloroflexota bacterium]MQC48098.1 hypothetical protein [Chloroflexota bacterium]
MEWLIFLAVVVATALFVAWPRAADPRPGAVDVQELRGEREAILAELREVDDDALAERITSGDRRESRRILGIRLLRVTEALRDLGDDRHGPDPTQR